MFVPSTIELLLFIYFHNFRDTKRFGDICSGCEIGLFYIFLVTAVSWLPLGWTCVTLACQWHVGRSLLFSLRAFLSYKPCDLTDYHVLLKSVVMLIWGYCFPEFGFTQFLGSICLLYRPLDEM